MANRTGDVVAQAKLIKESGNEDAIAQYAAALTDLAWLEIYFAEKPDAAAPLLEALRGLSPAENVTVPRLEGWSFLLSKKLVEGLSRYEQALNSKWINKLMEQMRQVQKKVDRLHFKRLGSILALQERIGQETMKAWEQLPTIEPSSPERGS